MRKRGDVATVSDPGAHPAACSHSCDTTDCIGEGGTHYSQGAGIAATRCPTQLRAGAQHDGAVDAVKSLVLLETG
jgi:hypothetical protein